MRSEGFACGKRGSIFMLVVPAKPKRLAKSAVPGKTCANERKEKLRPIRGTPGRKKAEQVHPNRKKREVAEKGADSRRRKNSSTGSMPGMFRGKKEISKKKKKDREWRATYYKQTLLGKEKKKATAAMGRKNARDHAKKGIEEGFQKEGPCNFMPKSPPKRR